MHRNPHMKHFKSPWGRSLIIISTAATLLCLGVTIIPWLSAAPAHLGRFAFWVSLLPLALVVTCALFTIRGYTITQDTLEVHRLLWRTRIPLEGLQSVQFDPHAMRRSIRTFGNGGFFSFTRFFWNKALGAYRAFVTDSERTTVLRFPSRTIVLSPEPEDEFIRELSSRVRNA